MSDYQKLYNEDEAYYGYVEEVSDETYQQLLSAARSAINVFGIPQTNDGRELAGHINRIVESILETGEYPKEYYENDITLVAVELGCLYGFALSMGYDWRWRMVGNSPDDITFSWAIGSTDDNWFCPCGIYLNKILTGQNYGIDGKNDNTVLLLYNMIGETIKTTPEKKLTLLW